METAYIGLMIESRMIALPAGSNAGIHSNAARRTRLVYLLLVLTLGVWAGGSRGALFTDGIGREVELDQAPRRIVALAPSITETLYFLGLGDRVVGVTRFSAYPPEVARKPKIGSYVDPNPEQIIGLSPDLVIGTADGNPPTVMHLLKRVGIPVFMLDPKNIRQVIEALVIVGELCGVRERALTLAAGLSRRVDAIVARTADRPKPLVFLQVNLKPIMAASKNTFLDDLVRLAGGVNMTRDEPATYPRIDLEAVIRGRPEVILIFSMDRQGAFEEARQQWLEWTLIPAARDGRVHLVDADLTNRPSPRIVRGLEVLARYLHPDAGWDDRGYLEEFKVPVRCRDALPCSIGAPIEHEAKSKSYLGAAFLK